MKKQCFSLAALCLAATTLLILTSCHATKSTKRIGIVVPLEHTAMREIVTGFEITLHKEFDDHVDIQVINAHGDMNLQKVIIQQMIQQPVDIIVPIGLGATQMSAHMTQSIPIVSLAAHLDKADLQPNLTGVNDELDPALQLHFMRTLFPKLHKIVLVHSPSEKVIPELKRLSTLCRESSIELSCMMISNLNELYPTAQNISQDTDLIFVLKDHLVVSGISTLAQIAAEKKIPLMTSDEGSVQQGGAFALGVREASLGEIGAKIVQKILNNPHHRLPAFEQIKLINVFINSRACHLDGISIADLESAAKQCAHEAILLEES